jgi:glycosyltransferase involved in cell wall biosynthesis
VPRSLTEAAASGLPIITTDAPGCREVVEDDVNGLLMPVRTVAPLVKAICLLHENPDVRRRLGRAGRALAVARFDQRLIFDATFEVYRELLTPTPLLSPARSVGAVAGSAR